MTSIVVSFQSAFTACLSCTSHHQGELQMLLQQFGQLVNVWRTMSAHGAALDYHGAAEIITTSEALAKAFYRACEKVRARQSYSSSRQEGMLAPP